MDNKNEILNENIFDNINDDTIRKINKLLDVAAKSNSKKTSLVDELSIDKSELVKEFYELFDGIDRELKQNEELNTKINETEAIKKDLLFNIKNKFSYINSNNERVCDEVGLQNARKFVQEWDIEKAILLVKRNKLRKEGKFFLNFISRARAKKINNEIELNDRKYEELSKIFDEEKRIESLDKEELNSKINKNNAEIKKTIDTVIDNHLTKKVNKTPEIVLFDKIAGKSFYITSSSFLSNKNNQNLGNYFNCRMVKDRINEILKELSNAKIKADEKSISTEKFDEINKKTDDLMISNKNANEEQFGN